MNSSSETSNTLAGNAAYAAYAAYYNVARHNILEVLNAIASKVGLSISANDDQIRDHPLLKQLERWATEDDREQGKPISDIDIRRIKQVVNGLQKALPILHDDFVQNVSGQKLSLDFKSSAIVHGRIGKGQQSRDSDKPIRTWRLSEIYWALDLLLKQVMGLRNFYTHAYQDEVLFDTEFNNLLGLWFDAARRVAKVRFGFLTDEVKHLERFKSKTKEPNPNALHAPSKKCGEKWKLTEKGAAFFCCLFLDKQQSNEFLKQLPDFKYDAARPYQATLRTYTLWSLRLPYVRLETDSTLQSLGLDMLSELARCR